MSAIGPKIATGRMKPAGITDTYHVGAAYCWTEVGCGTNVWLFAMVRMNVDTDDTEQVTTIQTHGL